MLLDERRKKKKITTLDEEAKKVCINPLAYLTKTSAKNREDLLGMYTASVAKNKKISSLVGEKRSSNGDDHRRASERWKALTAQIGNP